MIRSSPSVYDRTVKSASVPTDLAGSMTGRRLATEETRRRVIRAARAAFASQGYGGATIRGIAREAGLTAMAVYTYAPSKADLFRLVYEDGIQRIYGAFADVVEQQHSLMDEV